MFLLYSRAFCREFIYFGSSRFRSGFGGRILSALLFLTWLANSCVNINILAFFTVFFSSQPTNRLQYWPPNPLISPIPCHFSFLDFSLLLWFLLVDFSVIGSLSMLFCVLILVLLFLFSRFHLFIFILRLDRKGWRLRMDFRPFSFGLCL